MKKRIAVLGGGVGAMSAVWTLMQESDWQEKYDITIYQMGWRLGGKGASGRNRAVADRIEEHGLHIWLGFYENAFHTIRQVYETLARPEGAPLRTWKDAFKPDNLIVFTEHIDGVWKRWPIEFPTNDDEPGTGGVLPHVWDYIHMILEWMGEQLRSSMHLDALLRKLPEPSVPRVAEWLLKELEAIGITVAEVTGAALLEAAYGLARSLDPNVASHKKIHHRIILGLVDHFMDWLWKLLERELDEHDELRRLFIVLDIAHAMIHGMFADGIIEKGSFDVVNDVDLRAWLVRNGASEKYSAYSAPMQAIYDLVFAYEAGNWQDNAGANLEAGTGLRGSLRMLLTYKGSIYWRMQAGMGDTIFGPFYEILSRYPENIRVAFFHQVMDIDSDDGENVTAIRMFEQVRLAPGRTAYEPLWDVKGLPCWPSEPFYDQLDPADAAALRDGHINLESFWTPWKERAPERSRTLRRGEDYDDVICAIPPAMLAHLLSDRIRNMPAWSAMLDHVKSVQTQAVQLWFRPDLGGLGWQGPTPLVGGYREPFSTWADMTELLVRENWPDADPPHNLAYIVGVMEDAGHIPPPGQHDFPATQVARCQRTAEDWLRANAPWLWPDAVNPDGTFRKDVLLSEFRRVNIDPNERYVLSVTNSTKYRMSADGSGLKNLYLAGDWILNIIDAGCVEAGVIGGMRAARALSGVPVHIIGEDLETAVEDARGIG